MSNDTTRKTEAAQILVVDDNEMNRALLSSCITRPDCRVLMAADGSEALDIMRQQRVDLVLLDISMPVMDGYEVLGRMKDDPSLRQVPVVMVTAIGDTESTVRCIELGADDYLVKPFNPVLLRARIGACLERKRLVDLEKEYRSYMEQYNLVLRQRVREQVQQINTAHRGLIFAMSKLAESRDPDTGEHLERIREYCRIIALGLGETPQYADIIDKTFIENIYAASPLHDIGKVAVPDAILCKPGKLTQDEWTVMKLHPVFGAETLREVDRQHPGNAFVRLGIEIAESHHERWDGSGYPKGLSGKSIPLVGRILALADAYDALTSRRCYKEARSPEVAREIIKKDTGTHFDPDIAAIFLQRDDAFRSIRKTYGV